jgi:transposase
VDHWAWRKGRVYGTVLVDLEHHQVIDLVPNRSGETLAAWLRAHPGVEIITATVLPNMLAARVRVPQTLSKSLTAGI